jgi:hypothetical protein
MALISSTSALEPSPDPPPDESSDEETVTDTSNRGTSGTSPTMLRIREHSSSIASANKESEAHKCSVAVKVRL